MSARLTLVGTLVGVVGLVATVVGLVGPPAHEDTPGSRAATSPVLAAEARPRIQPAPPAPAVHVPPPSRIEVPSIGVEEELTARGLRPDGSLDTPDFGAASWYAPGPRPGEPGGAVVVAHVHGPDGPDVFWELATLEPGDTIRVHRADAVATFVVDAVVDAPKEQLPYDEIWPATDAPLLRLITCGGKRDPERGYPDNTVVFAHLAFTVPSG